MKPEILNNFKDPENKKHVKNPKINCNSEMYI